MKAKIDEGEEGIEEAMAEIKADEKRKRKAVEALGPDGKPKLTKRLKRVADHSARVAARGGETAEAAAKREVFVGNIPKDVNQDQLRTHFSGCGEITEVRVAMSGNLKKSRGYAFIAFKDKASCEAAITTMDGQPFAGKPLKVGRPTGVDSTPSENNPDKEPKGNPELEVMFNNLPFSRKKKALKRKFRFLGATDRIRIPAKKEGSHIGKHNGLAFVTYKTEEGFKAAMALNGTEWHGRVLKVEKRLDVPRPDKSKKESKDVQMGEGEKEEEDDEDDEDEEEEEEDE
mmetsp:Transcript_41665/g.62187  ORF Transcript_41665/g.62187 Transcript_41665/m.62187 type:complete len:287 (+) Transcript_41665:117-977(+)